MDPLEASYLVVACCVLHNMCIEWGVSELSPMNNADPDLEVQIQIDALSSFLEARKDILQNRVPKKHRVPKDKSNHVKGNYRRQMIIHRYHGGPAPMRLPRSLYYKNS